MFRYRTLLDMTYAKKHIESELALVYLNFSLLTPSFAQVIRNIYANLPSE